MRNFIFALLITSLFTACSSQSNDESYFVTKLGNDTLAVEQFLKTESGMAATVILRSPETRFSKYSLELDETGGISQMQRTDYPPNVGFSGEGALTQSIARQGDSLSVKVYGEDGTSAYMAPYEAGTLPFIDMVHWPFELAFNAAVETGQDTVNQPLLSGNRISNFIIADIEGDSMTIRHPFRGVMGVNVTPEGNIKHLDAGLTTRKLKVNRVSSVDMNALADRYAGNPIGELSGAVSAEYAFANTNFRVDYGSPQKRGRDLFGNIVPYGEVWRTGANRATHFYTSEDLRFGDLEVPAGEYTLFSIPEEEGGTLIINSQTGQNGNSYDESRDLGRVPMNVTTKDDVTEAFTITVEETDEGGRINLIWGNTIYSSDFMID
ncbi:MAG: DUF2911 domain-containing protein [Gracilimonas sp.]|nr:DUF2911 domain-containing protein [Gracilimonas sp.]